MDGIISEGFNVSPLAGFLSSAIVALAGAIVYIYKAKEKANSKHLELLDEYKDYIKESIGTYKDIGNNFKEIRELLPNFRDQFKQDLTDVEHRLKQTIENK